VAPVPALVQRFRCRRRRQPGGSGQQSRWSLLIDCLDTATLADHPSENISRSATSLDSIGHLCRASSAGSQVAAGGLGDQFGAAVKAQLGVDAGEVLLDGVDADEQPFADRRVGVPVGDEPHNLALRGC
jgi:hypothetical protein